MWIGVAAMRVSIYSQESMRICFLEKICRPSRPWMQSPPFPIMYA